MIHIQAIIKYINKQPPARIIAGGFAIVILLGAGLLMLPVSRKDGVPFSFLDAVFTSTTAACVTGLVTVDPGSTFSLFGKILLAILIQIGGLGVATAGIAIFLFAGSRLSIRQMSMIKESLNIGSYKSIVPIFRKILLTTLLIESAGAILCFFRFVREYTPLQAAGISIFHAVSAFNNAGIDIFGNGTSMIPYQNDIYLNIVTILLITFGGIGYLVIFDVLGARRQKRLRLHTKVVLVTSLILVLAGTLLIKATDHITWLGALFQSVSCRTAGFATFDFGRFSNASLFVCILLMVIGASPGSTGGGIKTTTLFTLFCAVRSTALNRSPHAFRRKLPNDTIRRALLVFLLAFTVVCCSTLALCVTDPQNSFIQNFFEAASAHGTAGLSTGITDSLSAAGKIVMILTMYTGRIGAFAITTLWAFRTPETAVFTEEAIAIG